MSDLGRCQVPLTHYPSRKSHKHSKTKGSRTYFSDQETEAWRQSTERNNHSRASNMLGALPTLSQGGTQGGSSPRPHTQQKAAFMAPRSGPGWMFSVLPLEAVPLTPYQNMHTGQDTVKGALHALLLCLQSPSTSSMPWTHLTKEKSQAELRPSWDQADTLRGCGASQGPVLSSRR